MCVCVCVCVCMYISRCKQYSYYIKKYFTGHCQFFITIAI